MKRSRKEIIKEIEDCRTRLSKLPGVLLMEGICWEDHHMDSLEDFLEYLYEKEYIRMNAHKEHIEK